MTTKQTTESTTKQKYQLPGPTKPIWQAVIDSIPAVMLSGALKTQGKNFSDIGFDTTGTLYDPAKYKALSPGAQVQAPAVSGAGQHAGQVFAGVGADGKVTYFGDQGTPLSNLTGIKTFDPAKEGLNVNALGWNMGAATNPWGQNVGVFKLGADNKWGILSPQKASSALTNWAKSAATLPGPSKENPFGAYNIWGVS